jgi:hypothetical protein
MGLDGSAKIQVHVGGAYCDKILAMKTFEKNYDKFLSPNVRRRLVKHSLVFAMGKSHAHQHS